jgi:preprotein translocase subunit SecA
MDAGAMESGDVQAMERELEGIYFPKGTIAQVLAEEHQDFADELYQQAVRTYEDKEAQYGEKVMRELERVVMLRVVDEYWMDHIDAMDDLKQGIGLRAYGQHDPVIAYKEEGFEMFESTIRSIREETVRRAFLAYPKPQQELQRKRVAKETGTDAANNPQVKKTPVRKSKKIGPNDDCHCGSGKKYKKCCMQKDKLSQ